MRMEAPWLWFALPPMLALVWWLHHRSYAPLRSLARWSSLAIRILLLVCLVAALSRPSLVRRVDQAHVIFLLDVSPSVSRENLDAAMQDIDRLARQTVQERQDDISVIAFGAQPRLMLGPQSSWDGWPGSVRELLTFQASLPELRTSHSQAISRGAAQQELADLAGRIAALERFRDETAGDSTNPLRAVRLGLNCGQIGRQRRIFIWSDANFNRGSWDEACGAIRSAEAQLTLIPLDRPIPPEVAMADLSLPPSVRVNQGFSADLALVSTIDTPAQVVLYRDGVMIQTIDLPLRIGRNVLRIPGLFVREKGFHTLEAVVRPQTDQKIENNSIRAIVSVPGEARILYVDSDESQQSYLKSALELEGMQVEARPASGVPQSLPELLSFDAFVLCNVPADRLTMRQMQLIRTYVQDFGGGFIMLGGDESFGLGGYYNTPVEEVLPVRMPIQKDASRPSLALMLVIDKSGSMEGVKIQLAKRAAIATAEAINPRDQIGVVGFDSESRVILDLTMAGDRSTISAQIASLEAGGGTFLQPGLEDAHGLLMDSNARRKHIIILSDGQTQGFGYDQLAQQMAADGITISTIGIGEGADMNLLEQVAAAGGGRSYFTNDFYSIPQIFTREALRASKSMLVERLVQPMAADDDELLQEIDADDLPALTGYVATTPKENAKVILVSDSGDPLLAKWRWGLGRSAAFMSETKPRWAEDWIRWPDFAKFWSQVVRGVAGQELDQEITVEVTHRLDDDGVRITADVRDASGRFISDREISLVAHDPDTGVSTLSVEREGPGLFSALSPRITWGRSQQLALHVGKQGDEGLTIPYGFVYSYSPEFGTLDVNQSLLDQLESRDQGRVLRLGQAVPVLAAAESAHSTPLWLFFLILSLMLAPLDILVRRMG